MVGVAITVEARGRFMPGVFCITSTPTPQSITPLSLVSLCIRSATTSFIGPNT